MKKSSRARDKKVIKKKLRKSIRIRYTLLREYFQGVSWGRTKIQSHPHQKRKKNRKYKANSPKDSTWWALRNLLLPNLNVHRHLQLPYQMLKVMRTNGSGDPQSHKYMTLSWPLIHKVYIVYYHPRRWAHSKTMLTCGRKTLVSYWKGWKTQFLVKGW